MLGLANVLSASSSTDQETYSLLLDGVDDYLYASGLDGAAFPVTGSLSLWVKGDFSNSPTNKAIFDNYASDRDHFFIRNITGSGNCQIQAYGVAHIAAGNTGYVAGGTFPLVDSQWNHIVVTWDTANELFKAYHNSDLKISTSIIVTAGEWVPDEQEVKFGVNSLGSMDETAIWDAVLDAEAVAAIYNNGRPFNLTNDRGDYDNASDLVGYWKMFDGTNDDKVNGVVFDQTASTIGSNIVPESSFEAVTTWTAVTASGSTSALDTSFSHSGSNSWKLVVDGTDENIGVISDAITVEANTVYKVSWWSYVPTGSDTYVQVSGAVSGGGSAWRRLGGTATHNGGGLPATDVWTQSTFYFVTGSGTGLTLKLTNGALSGSNGDVRYFDDIELVKIGGNPGITAAEATFSTDTPSKAPRGWALELDGAGDLLNTGSTFQSTHRGSFSWSCWVKLDDGHPAADDTILGTALGGTDIMMINVRKAGDADAGKIEFRFEGDGDPASYETDAAVFSDGATGWTHIVCTATYNAGGADTSFAIYVNGSAVAGTLTGSITHDKHLLWTTTHNIYLGAANNEGTANNAWAGNIGHVAVWDVPLDASAVATIYGELWDGISGDHANWVKHGNNTIAEDDDAVRVTFYNNADGAKILFSDATDLNRDLTVGKRYTCSADIKVNTGSVELSVRHGSSNTNSSAVTATDYVRRSITFTCENATNDRLELNAMSSGEIAWVKNISLLDVDKRKVTDLSVDDGFYDNSGDLVGYWKMGDGQDDNVEAGVIHDATNPGFGSELVVNGGFSDYSADTRTYTNGGLNFANWTEQQNSGLRKFELTGDRRGIRCTIITPTTTAYHQRIKQIIADSLTIDKVYEFSCNILLSVSGDFRCTVETGASGDYQTTTRSHALTAGEEFVFKDTFRCDSVDSDLSVHLFPEANLASGQYYEIRNPSLKQLNGNPGLTAADATFVKLPV